MLLVLGKGGVGRTTTTALLAHGAHAAGLKVLVVRSTANRHFIVVSCGVDVRSVTAGSALEDYLLDQGFGNFARRLAQSGVIEVVGAAARNSRSRGAWQGETVRQYRSARRCHS